jgi:ankyrin repeat protein
LSSDFFTAIQNGEKHTVEQMLDQDPGLVDARNEQGISALLIATYYGESAIAALLIDRGANLDIYEAAATGSLARLRELTTAHPELINSFGRDGFHPLGLAAFFGHTQAVAYLVESGADVNLHSNNSQNVSPLIAASARQNMDSARLLVSRGADVNARQIHDFTALHNAAQNGQIEMAELLLAHGAEINARSQDGRTPLTFAREKNQTAMIEFLQLHGAVD